MEIPPMSLDEKQERLKPKPSPFGRRVARDIREKRRDGVRTTRWCGRIVHPF